MSDPRRALPLALAALAALAGCAGARRAGPAAVPDRRAFAIPGHGALEIEIPPGWTATEQQGEGAAPRSVRLEGEGGAFLALLTPFWNPGEPEDEAARIDTARLLADLARREALPGAAEGELALRELGGDGAQGFWFTATDRELVGEEPGEGEFRHVLQGAAAVGAVVLAFTLLDNAPGPQRERLLDVVRGARHAPAEEERGAAERPMEIDPGAETVPLRVARPGRSWAVLVDLPGFTVFRPTASADGAEVAVLGQNPGTGVVASVILRPARGATDATACREADLAKVRAAVPALRDLELLAGAEAARAAYAIPELDGRPLPQAHAHAWLFRDDVCVNVHVSKTEPGPGDAERLDHILASARFGEEL